MKTMTGASSAVEFERHRDHLIGVAYRMLGTLQDAEDAVQETYLRYLRAADSDIHDLRAWLTRTIARICLDECVRLAHVGRVMSVNGCPNPS